MKDRKWLRRFKENGILILSLVMIVFAFYYTLVRGGITTHDELSNLFQVRMGTYFPKLDWGRWSMTFMNAIPSYFQALAQNQWVYRIYTMVGLLIACGGMAMLLRKVTNKAVAWVAVLLFFMFAQIQLDHDGLIAFSFSYQFNTVYVFISLALYWQWLHERKNSTLIISLVLYLLACMAYEAFVGYGLLFFLLALIYQADKGKISIKELFKDLILHALVAVIYFGIYVLVRRNTGFENGDTTVGSDITISEVATTAWKLATGMFPLEYRPRGFKWLLIRGTALTGENILRWALIIFLVIVIYKVIKESGEIGLKRWIGMTVFCGVGMFLPGAPAALTRKMINWMCYDGIRSYGVSYYSYFFIIAWMAVTAVFLYHLCRKNRIVLGVMCAVIALVTDMTMIGNEVYTVGIKKQQNKYDLYCGMVETEYFKGIEDDAVLYAPGYIGIHYYIETLGEYANGKTGKHVTSVNEKEEIDFTRPVYLVKEDTAKDVMYLSRMTEDGYTDEVFVYAPEEVDGLGMLGARREGAGPAILKVNGASRNYYGEEIITGDLGARGTSMVVSCAEMKAGSLEVYEASDKMSNGVLKIKGIYGREMWGRWAEKEMVIEFENTGEKEIEAELRMTVETPTKSDGEILVKAEGVEERVRVKEEEGRSAKVVVPISLKSGKNEIMVSSDAEDMKINGDMRKMNFKVYDMEMKIGDEVVDLMSIARSE